MINLRALITNPQKREEILGRFRQFVRRVMFNRIWLMDVDEENVGLNVKKNIAMIVRPQRKIGMLTMADKSLLRKPHSMRSIEERRALVSLISGLTCFSAIPPKVRAHLVPIIKFVVLGPGRIIIKEGHPPSFVYFLLAGEVEATRRVFTGKKWEDKVIMLCGPGDCLGDVEFYDKCKRRNTYTARTEVELVVVYDDEFDEILRPVMTKQWEQKKTALQNLGYFDFFTPEQERLACKLGVLREFLPLQGLYHFDKGYLSNVHFVISGECAIYQRLKMKVTTRESGKSFQLLDAIKDEKDFVEIWEAQRKKKRKKEPYQVNIQDLEDSQDEQEVIEPRKRQFKAMDLKSIEISCGLRSEEEEAEEESEYSSLNEEYGKDEDMSGISEDSSHVYDHSDSKPQNLRKYQFNYSHKKKNKSHKKDIKNKSSEADNKIGSELLQKGSQDARVIYKSAGQFKGTYKPWKKKKEPIVTIEDHIIDVGTLSFGGIFSLGETMEERLIMARSTVQCLLLPRYWLFERPQNPGNLWQRRIIHIEANIPNRRALFDDFLATRRWEKFKREYMAKNVSFSKSNPTKWQDIPILLSLLKDEEEAN